MKKYSGKLELTWVNKDEELNIEPRILIEDKSKSYGLPTTGNMLIHGDNLIALKALERDFAGKIKCVYIDPPFNTGAAFEHYDDNVEHSIWLNLMSKRLTMIRNLLTEDGAIFVNLDDSESAYCKVIMDQVFGRKNYLNEIIVATNKSFGFKSTSDGIFKQANHLLFYAKNKESLVLNTKYLFVEKGYDPQYKFQFLNTDRPESEWTWKNINEIVAHNMGYSSVNEAKKDSQFEQEVANYALENADTVFRTASVSGGALIKRRETIQKSKANKTIIVRHPNDDMDYMFIGGERVIFYKERLKMIDGVMVPGELITDIWDDISVEGLASEGGIDFPKGKKPEKLIKRCIELCTSEQDYVLDSFLGSGTTAAVAHKMNRRWIGIELGEQAYTHCKKRLDSVIDGTDKSGITKTINWKGGGGYKFYELAEPLLVKNPIIPVYEVNPTYTFEMVCEAVCKIEAFTYAPADFYHGYSTENRFIHVTFEYVNGEYVAELSAKLNEKQSLIIYCLKHQKGIPLPDNIEIRRIPKDIQEKCKFESEEE